MRLEFDCDPCRSQQTAYGLERIAQVQSKALRLPEGVALVSLRLLREQNLSRVCQSPKRLPNSRREASWLNGITAKVKRGHWSNAQA